MKKCLLCLFCLGAVLALSYLPANAAVYRSKVRSSCSGVSVAREYSRDRAGCSGVSRARSRAACSGVSRSRVYSRARGCSGGF